MKKLLILLLLMFVTTQAEAGLLSQNRFVSSNDVTIADMDGNVSNLLDWANGNVEGGINIKEGTLVSEDFAKSSSPIVRWDEGFNNFTFSGMVPATSVNLVSDVSEGISYVDGFRVENLATEVTYTLSKDTFLYVKSGGGYEKCEVTLGVTDCDDVPDNSLLLAKVTTDADNITAVDDQRTTSIQLTVTTSNFPADYRSRAYVSRDTNATVHAEPGNLAIGSEVFSRTSNSTTRNLATASHWIDSSKATGNEMVFIYAYNSSGSAWDIKFSEEVPDLTDVDDNTSGTKRYHLEGGVYYRAIGWIFQSTDNTYPVYAIGNIKDVGVHNSNQRSGTGTDQDNGETDYWPILGGKIDFYTNGDSPVKVSATYATEVAASGQKGLCTVKIDGTEKGWSGWAEATGTCSIVYQDKLSTGKHTAEAFFKTLNGAWTASVEGSTYGAGQISFEEL